jgi:hypothetical protein
MPPTETLIEGGNAKVMVTAHGLVGITVSIVDRQSGELRSAVRLPYPSAGYGGHELVVSPSGHWLALFLYSGQSEVGYELFELVPELAHAGGLPYMFGEGDGPVFSTDERFLVMAWETYFDWWSDASLADSDHDREIEWGALAVHELPNGAIFRVPLVARVPAGWSPEPSSWTAPTELRFTTPHELSLRTPWGAEPRIPFPLPEDGPVVVA